MQAATMKTTESMDLRKPLRPAHALINLKDSLSLYNIRSAGGCAAQVSHVDTNYRDYHTASEVSSTFLNRSFFT
jgi:hypothetical protein